MPDDNSNLDGTGDIVDGNVGGIDPSAVPEPKRGRGRPAGSGKSASAGSGKSEPAKPGKPARAAQTKKASHLDVGVITLGVSFLSGFISKTTKQPSLALDSDETEQISKAAANVAEFYDVPVSPVVQAWMALGMTVGSIYSAKIAAIKINRPKVEPEKSAPASVLSEQGIPSQFRTF